MLVASLLVLLALIVAAWLYLGRPSRNAAPRAIAATEPSIERGQYLVAMANCVSCHTAKNGQPFAGGQPFRTNYGFLGAIYSSNITPDLDTGLGKWTEEQFIQAMRSGVAPGDRHLFPAFPYTSFTKLTVSDVKSIYAYLRTIPAVSKVPPQNGVWFRQRWALGLWNALFFQEGELPLDPRQSDTWNQGQYLVEALGHCGACHSPRNMALAEIKGAAFTGGVHVDEIEEGRDGIWSAPNLTSANSGLSKWSVDELKKYLKNGSSRRAGVFGPMNEVIANSLRFSSETDAVAMATYLKNLPANGDHAVQNLSDAERSAGQAIYDEHCEECHASTGRGGFRKAPPVAGSVIVQAANPASLLNVILFGAKSATDIPNGIDTWEDMPGFKSKLNDTQVAQLANFLRSTWSNQGGQVAAKTVAVQR